MSEKYKELKQRSKQRGERADCTVCAVALLTNADYDEAHRAMHRAGRNYRHSASLSSILEALRSLGAWVSPGIPPPAKTVRTVERVLPPGRFLVVTSKHVLAAVDGEILDWTKGRLHRVIRLYEVGL